MKALCWTVALMLLITGGMARMAGYSDAPMMILFGLIALATMTLIEWIDA